jgi:hypothetical protein
MNNLENLVWRGRGGEVEIWGSAAKKSVSNRAANQGQFVPRRGKSLAECDKQRRIDRFLKIRQCFGNRLHAVNRATGIAATEGLNFAL